MEKFLIKHGFKRINPIVPKVYLWWNSFRECRLTDLDITPGVRLNLYKRKDLKVGLLKNNKSLLIFMNQYWIK